MRIVIHNFGPIKEADIETKRYTVFIGQTSTGKSVAAKLIAMANSLDFLTLKDGDYVKFTKQLLPQYCIDFEIGADTSIEIMMSNVSWAIRNNEFTKKGEIAAPWSYINTAQFDNHAALDLELMLNMMSGNFDMKTFADKTFALISDSFVNGKPLNADDLPEYQKNSLRIGLIKFFNKMQSPVYIPAERILMSLFTNSVFSLLQNNLPIPESIKRFGSQYEEAKANQANLPIDFLGVEVKFSNGMDTIRLNGDNVEIEFKQASSGMQSIIPLWAVFCSSLQYSLARSIVIEEPELNLFPTLQVALVNRMVELLKPTSAKLVITTHSPYILSALDNLIYAKDVYDRADESHKEKVAEVVSADAMVPYDDVAAYHFNDDGIVTYICDPEARSTGAYALDTASNETANVFNQLLAIDNEL